MKELRDYINKSISLIDYINEAKTFGEYDKELEGLEPDLAKVKKIKIMSRTFADNMEELNTVGIGDEELFYKAERLVKQYVAEKAWQKCVTTKKSIKYGSGITEAERAKQYMNYFKALFSAISALYKRDNCSFDSVIAVITGICQYWMDEINYDDTKLNKQFDNMLGKMIAKLEDTAKALRPGWEDTIDKNYEWKKQNLIERQKQYESEKAYRESFKSHKFFIISECGEGAINIKVYPTQNFDDIKACIEDFKKEYTWVKYPFDQWIKSLANGKPIYSPTISAGTSYHFTQESAKENKIPFIGYVDEDYFTSEKEVFGWSEYDKRWTIRGRWKRNKNLFMFHDSLWIKHELA